MEVVSAHPSSDVARPLVYLLQSMANSTAAIGWRHPVDGVI